MSKEYLKEMINYFKTVIEPNCEHDFQLSENSSGVIFMTCKKCFLSKIVRKSTKNVGI